MSALKQNKLKLINMFEKLENAILLENNIIACEQRHNMPIKSCASAAAGQEPEVVGVGVVGQVEPVKQERAEQAEQM